MKEDAPLRPESPRPSCVRPPGVRRTLVSSSLGALVLLTLATAPAACHKAPAEGGSPELLVFAAASLTEALAEVSMGFEERAGVRIVFSFGGSNVLARQILAGAPADLFISANSDRMDELETTGLVRSRDRVELLSNRLAVIVPTRSDLVLRSPGDLERVRRLALGDPDAVPAGIYARRWLQKQGLWERLQGRVVPTLDVRAALAAVESQNADAAIVYRTDAALSRRVRVALDIPAHQTPGVVYPASVLARSTSSHAHRFLAHLSSPVARAAFTRLGFEPLQRRP